MRRSPLFLVVGAALLSGCTSYPYGGQPGYGQSGYGQPGYGGGYAQAPAYADSGAYQRYGVVTGIAPYRSQGGTSGNEVLGTAAGAVVGGLLGNQFGAGKGRTAATVAGAVAGGVAGNMMSSGSSAGSDLWRVSVRLDNGRTIQVDQPPSSFGVGSRVEVVERGNGVELVPR